jgi:hypothetical protein
MGVEGQENGRTLLLAGIGMFAVGLVINLFTLVCGLPFCFLGGWWVVKGYRAMSKND